MVANYSAFKSVPFHKVSILWSVDTILKDGKHFTFPHYYYYYLLKVINCVIIMQFQTRIYGILRLMMVTMNDAYRVQ